MPTHHIQQNYDAIKQLARENVWKHRSLEISEWQDLLATLLQAGYPSDLVNQFGETVNARYLIVGADWKHFFEQLEQHVVSPAINATTPQGQNLPDVGNMVQQASALLAQVQNTKGVEAAQEILNIYGATAIGEVSKDELPKLMTVCKMNLKGDK